MGMLCRAESLAGPEGPLAEPQRVAVKQLSVDGVRGDRAFVEREARVLRALSGRPYVPSLYSMHLPAEDDTDGHAYLVME